MHFIELTYLNSANKVYVNMLLVQCMDTLEKCTKLHFGINDSIIVMETPKQILEMC